MEEPIRLAIVTDDRLLRDCLASALTEEKGFRVVGLSAEQLVAPGPTTADAFDVVLLDAGLAHHSALELTTRAGLKFPGARLVVFGLDEAEENFLRFLEAGASGYVLRGESLEDLMSVVRMVRKGESVCSPRAAYTLFSRVAELAHDSSLKQRSESAKLTSREREILQLMAGDLSNKQIAARLDKSLYTVKNHVHNILEKLEVHDRQDAIRLAYRDGIIRRCPEPPQSPRTPAPLPHLARGEERARAPRPSDPASD